jgi:uncharacterized SAM-binding protein YcdF (DUF218 family)
MAAPAPLRRLIGRRAAPLLLALGLIAAGWSVGFGLFLRAVLAAPQGDLRPAEGIVVLTGGAVRIDEGVRLLKAGMGRALLISGVGERFRIAELSPESRRLLADPALAALVTFGHAATSTRGNAEEARVWAEARGYHSLILVTASYHMPRARLVFTRAMPGMVIEPWAVSPPAMRTPWRGATLRLLAFEYTKYLLARAGLDRLGGEGERR